MTLNYYLLIMTAIQSNKKGSTYDEITDFIVSKNAGAKPYLIKGALKRQLLLGVIKECNERFKINK